MDWLMFLRVQNFKIMNFGENQWYIDFEFHFNFLIIAIIMIAKSNICIIIMVRKHLCFPNSGSSIAWLKILIEFSWLLQIWNFMLYVWRSNNVTVDMSIMLVIGIFLSYLILLKSYQLFRLFRHKKEYVYVQRSFFLPI